MRDSIIWSAPFDMSGYGVAARGYVRALDEFGVRVRVEDRSVSRSLAGKGVDEAVNRFLSRLKLNDVPANATRVQHQNPDIFEAQHGGPRRKNVGLSVFEMLTIPGHWAAKCDMMDEIWTPSQYSKEAFVAGGVSEDRVHVIPHFVDTRAFRPGDRRWPIGNLRGFNFLSVFDFTERKGWRELLQAYWRTFRRSDDVSLTLKVYFGSFDETNQLNIMQRVDEWRSECGFRKQDTAPVYFYGFDIPHSLMAPFYCTFDAYAMLGREGFGLPFAEAMACGLPTIGPAVGGNTEFMTDENSFLVERTGTEPVDDELVSRAPAYRGLEWPTYSVDGLGYWMRYVYDHPKDAKVRAMRGREDIRRRLSYDRIARMIVDRIADRLPTIG